MKSNYIISIGAFVGGALGVSAYLYLSGTALFWTIAWGAYWGFFFGLLAKIVESVIYRNPIIAKLGSYFQSWGAVGTFVGLIIMTGKIGSCLSGGETSAIKEQLAGFSICFLTSLVGVLFAIIVSVIADVMGTDD